MTQNCKATWLTLAKGVRLVDETSCVQSWWNGFSFLSQESTFFTLINLPVVTIQQCCIPSRDPEVSFMFNFFLETVYIIVFLILKHVNHDLSVTVLKSRVASPSSLFMKCTNFPFETRNKTVNFGSIFLNGTLASKEMHQKYSRECHDPIRPGADFQPLWTFYLIWCQHHPAVWLLESKRRRTSAVSTWRTLKLEAVYPGESVGKSS